MQVGWIYSPFFLRHQTGISHPERPERLEAIVAGLERAGLLARLEPLPFDSAPDELLEYVHEPAYVALVRMACEQGMSFIGCRETNICAESYDVARLAAGGVLAACDAVMAGRVGRAFCAIRPPGHHADSVGGGGYCLFNNVAIAAEYLLRSHGLKRVTIIDWDVHHGNGTQRIFESRDDVLFISLHETPANRYPHTGYATERGTGGGKGFTINCPLTPGSGETEYRHAFSSAVMPALADYQPSFLLISAGFDCATEDDAANLNLEPSSFAWMTQQLVDFADRHCQSRLISVLEGGYDLPSLSRSVCEHVRILLNPV